MPLYLVELELGGEEVQMTVKNVSDENGKTMVFQTRGIGDRSAPGYNWVDVESGAVVPAELYHMLDRMLAEGLYHAREDMHGELRGRVDRLMGHLKELFGSPSVH